MGSEISRRNFLKGSIAGALGLAATTVLGGAPAASAEGESVEPELNELPIPEMEAPTQTEYNCDVLVVGGGYAGLFAALEAKKNGADVLLVDKGKPGYSGLSGWASSHCYFDADLGDDAEQFEYAMKYANEWICNLDWVKTWIKESKSVYEKCVELGILNQYKTGAEEGYWVDGSIENDKLVEYHTAHMQEDRRPAFTRALKDNDIPCIEHCMIMDVVEEDGRVVGAMGLDVLSGTVLTFHAKSVILATGNGSYKPAGFPTGGDTFDGEYIGYTHGLPLTGQEFEDFHMSASFAPGNVLACNSWQYLESVWLCAPGGSTPENAAQKALGAANSVILPVFNSAFGVTPVVKESVVYGNGRGASSTGAENDPRIGKQSSGVFKGDIFGAAPGMYSHYAGGVFCGIDDVEGKTGIEGLWVAGDGTNGCMSTGGTKSAPSGWTSNFAGVQGKIAGEAAAAYVASAPESHIPESKAETMTEEILAPLSVTNGYDPNWARDVLTGIMAPYWVCLAKNEAAMESALTQVRQFREEIIPKLRATDGHSLRLCHEMKHKALIAEAKLVSSMERKESRGYHYRTDYPYRDDDNFLCYITVQQDENGQMLANRVEIKDEWKGDTSADYTERYATWRFPGENEAKGIEPVALQTSWGH